MKIPSLHLLLSLSLLSTAAGGPLPTYLGPSQPQQPPQRIGFLLPRAFSVLDVFGPLEVFQALSRQTHLELSLLSRDGAPASTAPVNPAMNRFNSSFFPAVVATHSVADPPELDVLIVPGGMGARSPDLEAEVEFIRSVFGKLEYLITICTGAGIAAQAGVLDGRRATTNKAAWGSITAMGPNVKWVSPARWVEDGKVWSSSGVTAGIDLVFEFVRKKYPNGTAIADFVAGNMEHTRVTDWRYDPWAENKVLKGPLDNLYDPSFSLPPNACAASTAMVPAEEAREAPAAWTPPLWSASDAASTTASIRNGRSSAVRAVDFAAAGAFFPRAPRVAALSSRGFTGVSDVLMSVTFIAVPLALLLGLGRAAGFTAGSGWLCFEVTVDLFVVGFDPEVDGVAFGFGSALEADLSLLNELFKIEAGLVDISLEAASGCLVSEFDGFFKIEVNLDAVVDTLVVVDFGAGVETGLLAFELNEFFKIDFGLSGVSLEVEDASPAVGLVAEVDTLIVDLATGVSTGLLVVDFGGLPEVEAGLSL
ncbi:hypothetical protein VTJ49DRAFT_1188 [Mycothermus thermophilus]|uniref:DJ-1/PfpI domain-containing protein n=1 Tax=Humicola insolens TaxID=85995 RepID=A0ABR3VD63_HUMIN